MKLIRADYIIIGAILMFMTAHAVTAILLQQYVSVAQNIGVAEDIVLQMERNPLARWVFSFEQMRFFWSFLIVPGVLAAFYWFARNKYRYDKILLESHAVFFLMIGSINAMNDISILIGVLIRGG